MSEYTNIQTAFAKAAYCYLNTPDTRYGDKYKVTLIFSPEDGKKIIEQIEEVIADNFTPKDAPKVARPYKTDEETGEVSLGFSSKKQPKVFDASGNLIPASRMPKIYSGSVLRVNGAFKAVHETSPKSIGRYMNEVQVKTLVEGGGGGFGSVDGGYTYSNDEPEETQGGFDNATDESGPSDPLDI